MLEQYLDNVSITFLVNDSDSDQHQGTVIELYDEDSNTLFAQIKLTNKQLVQALSRLAHTPVESCVMRGLDVLGKTRERKQLVFKTPVPGYMMRYDDRIEELNQLARDAADEGWTAGTYFNSQGSFFSKDDKNYARTSQYRYVDKEDQQQ